MVESTSLAQVLDQVEVDLDEFVCGMPRRAYFGHTRKRAVVIIASVYGELRKVAGKEKYADLPETPNDQRVMVAGLQRLGFADADILTVAEPSWAALHQVVLDLALDIQQAAMRGERTLIFTYYAGHGLADNNLHAQLNEAKIYPIEKMLRSLAKAEGSYVVALFDCCRERLAPGASRGAETEQAGMLDVQSNTETTTNFILTYGCPPSEGVPAKSTIAHAYIKYLKKAADPQGRIGLPGPLNFFVGADGKCEHSIKVQQALLLQWTAKTESDT